MDHGLLLSVLGAVISLGGIFIAIGVMKGKLQQAVETNAAQTRLLESCATKSEFARAIERSDDILALMQKRAEEDRAAGEGRYKELYGIITLHGERIAKLETSHEAILKALDEIKNNVNTGLKEIREDLKELRNKG